MKGHGVIVVDYTTGEKYTGLNEASQKLFVCKTVLIRRKKKFGNRFDLFGHDIEVETTKPIHSRSFMCEDTGEIFETAKEACRSVNGTISGFYNALHNHKAYKGKKIKKI